MSMPRRDPSGHRLLAATAERPTTSGGPPPTEVRRTTQGPVPEATSGRGVNLDPLVLWGLGVLAAAALVFLIGWFGVARNNEEWRQLPILISAGGAGAVLLAVGSSLLGANEHRLDREAIARLIGRIDDLERLMGEITVAQEAVAGRLDDLVDREVSVARGSQRGSQARSGRTRQAAGARTGRNEDTAE